MTQKQQPSLLLLLLRSRPILAVWKWNLAQIDGPEKLDQLALPSKTKSNSLSSFGRCRNLPRSIMAWKKLQTILPRNQEIHGAISNDSSAAKKRYYSSSIVPSIIQIIQAFFPSTTCTCANNWNSHLAQWIIHNNIYHWKTASSSRIEWSHGQNEIITYSTSTAAIAVHKNNQKIQQQQQQQQ